ncbi:ComEC/Rec2 family competence protein [Candidatus Gottesmanbacteria bacterium]|nr:ComEC/Rec2 family competence protein [Candidatus Gottesmanbacteria bacterium]
MFNPFTPALNSLLPEPQASLLNGILFGVKTTMPPYLYNALISTGTLHIIALSGMNISILANLTAQITLFLGRKASSIISICLIVLFVLFVGPNPSVVRAAIMGCLSLSAVYFGRQDWGVLSLFLAAGIMLLIDFSLIKNLSFQLSFLATLGIILANRKAECQSASWRRNGLINQFKYWFKENLKLTLSAQLFTLPIILYNFHRLSLVAPIANLAIEWVIQPIMVLGFTVAIAGWLWQPLGLLLAWFVWVPLTYLITIVEWLAKVPLASIQF